MVKCIEDEIPFELPAGWVWSRLEPIASLITDYVANGSFASLKANVRTYKEKNYALFVRTVDFANNFKGDLSYIDKESYDFLEKSKLFGGELMLSNIGASIGKVFKVPHFDIPMSLAPNAIILRFFNDTTCDYFEYVFKSFVGQEYLQFLSGGAAMPKFNKTDLRAMIVPVPPMNEQTKIVEAVRSTFTFIDDLDVSYNGLTATIQSVKSKILDLAIRGKLVPQNPEDEPASVLLDRIRAEKEELIKQGKIKRDKKESVIFKGEDNSYYENLPSSWAFSTLGMISKLVTKGTTPRGGNVAYADSGIGFLRAENIRGFDEISLENLKYVDEETHNDFLKRSILQSGDILITIAGTLGRTAIVTQDVLPLNTNQAIAIVRPVSTELVNIKYVVYALNADYISKTLLHQEVAMAIPNLSLENISDCIIPIPPLEEQNRIVNFIDNAFKTIDGINL